ncbi:MAG: endolytic transglycosylase MltG [Clostridia bacterium]|nr:MAG: endolytic transglycosylase MltG [Clostridia bacterium]
MAPAQVKPAEKPGRASRLLVIALAVILGLGSVLGLGRWYYQQLLAPVAAGSTEVYPVKIRPGAGAAEIASLLYTRGLIASPRVFLLYTTYHGYDKELVSGTYELSPGHSLPELVQQLRRGRTDEVTFTIPEGYTLKQIAAVLRQKGLLSSEADFLQAAARDDYDFPWMKELPPGPNRLEGFLFPDTYRVSPDDTAEDIIQNMLDRFTRVYSSEYQERAGEMELSTLEVVTLASLVEREAKLANERPVVAAVFLNRMKKGWKLESCATIQYILGSPKENLTDRDLQIPSPYNTYLHYGLPPGPIAAPGRASIAAVLYPADVPYLFFVARGDGSHYFSRTLAEHTAAKKLAEAK